MPDRPRTTGKSTSFRPVRFDGCSRFLLRLRSAHRVVDPTRVFIKNVHTTLLLSAEKSLMSVEVTCKCPVMKARRDEQWEIVPGPCLITPAFHVRTLTADRSRRAARRLPPALVARHLSMVVPRAYLCLFYRCGSADSSSGRGSRQVEDDRGLSAPQRASGQQVCRCALSSLYCSTPSGSSPGTPRPRRHLSRCRAATRLRLSSTLDRATALSSSPITRCACSCLFDEHR